MTTIQVKAHNEAARHSIMKQYHQFNGQFARKRLLKMVGIEHSLSPDGSLYTVILSREIKENAYYTNACATEIERSLKTNGLKAKEDFDIQII